MRAVAHLVLILLMCPSLPRAAGPPFTGHLRSTGIVVTNSVALPDGATVASGDAISTSAGGLAQVTFPAHGRLEVRPDSVARLGASRVLLERGAVAADHLPIDAGGYTIHAQNPSGGWFAVAHRGGRILVAAHRGNVLIAAAGRQPLVVPEGSFAQQDRPAPEQGQEEAEPQPADPPKRPAKSRKRRRAAAPAAGAGAGSAGGGWTIGGLSHSASVALVVAAGAGLASVGAAVSLSGENPSPSR